MSPILLFLKVVFASFKTSHGFYFCIETSKLVPRDLHNTQFSLRRISISNLNPDFKKLKPMRDLRCMKHYTNGFLAQKLLYNEFKQHETFDSIFEDNSQLILRTKILTSSNDRLLYFNDMILGLKPQYSSDKQAVLFTYQPNILPQLLIQYQIMLISEIYSCSKFLEKNNKDALAKTFKLFLENKMSKISFINGLEDVQFFENIFLQIKNFSTATDSKNLMAKFEQIIKKISFFVLCKRCSRLEETNLSNGTHNYVQDIETKVTENLKCFLFDLYSIYITCTMYVKGQKSYVAMGDILPSYHIHLKNCLIITFAEDSEILSCLENLVICLIKDSDVKWRIPYFYDKDARKIIFDTEILKNILPGYKQLEINFFMNREWDKVIFTIAH